MLRCDSELGELARLSRFDFGMVRACNPRQAPLVLTANGDAGVRLDNRAPIEVNREINSETIALCDSNLHAKPTL